MLNRLLLALEQIPVSIDVDIDSYKISAQALLNIAQAALDLGEINQIEHKTFWSAMVLKTADFLDLHAQEMS